MYLFSDSVYLSSDGAYLPCDGVCLTSACICVYKVCIVALSAHTHTHGVLDERGGQRSHAASPQHSLSQ